MVPEPLITVSESGERAVANINELRGYVESAARNENGAGTAEIRSGLRLLKASVDNNICMLRKAGRGENRKVISALASVSGAIDEQLFKMRAEAVCADAAKGRRQEMLALYREVSEPLGAFSDSVWNSPAFYEKRWDNKSANVNVCRGEIAKRSAESRTISQIFSSRRMRAPRRLSTDILRRCLCPVSPITRKGSVRYPGCPTISCPERQRLRSRSRSLSATRS